MTTFKTLCKFGVIGCITILMVSQIGCMGFPFANGTAMQWGIPQPTVADPQPTPTIGSTIPPVQPAPEIVPTSTWTLQAGVIIEKTKPVVTPTLVISESLEVPTEPLEKPEKVLLEDVPIGKQTRPLNCEFQSASDLLWYYGFPYSSDEIFQLVGHDPGGNPHVGFVGRSFDDPPGRLYPNGYGVYAEPIARGLAKVGIKAEVHYNESVEWLKEQIRQGNPVMIWATANMVKREPEYWTAKDGQRIKAVRGEHTYLVIGFDEKGVWVADPWVGRQRYFDWSTFLASWDILDRMSLIILGPETPEPTS